MSHAIGACPSGQSELKWCTRGLDHLPNWWANVLATNLREEVPVAMLRTPPSFFWRAVIVASMKVCVVQNKLSTFRWYTHLALEQQTLAEQSGIENESLP